MSYLPALLGLVITFALGAGLGLLAVRWERSRGLAEDRDGSLVADGAAGVLGFVGAAAAFLIGVLMLASVDHFNATAEVANREAIAYSAAFDSTTALPAAEREAAQHNLVCLMRSVSTDSWDASTGGDITGDTNTHAWFMRALSDLNAIAVDSNAQENALAGVEAELIEASKLGQERLLSGESQLPPAMWALVYLSLLVLVFVIVVMMRASPLLVTVSLVSVFLVSAGMVGVLIAFAEPFNVDTGVYISPQSIQAVMLRLEEAQPGPAWGACERLAAS